MLALIIIGLGAVIFLLGYISAQINDLKTEKSILSTVVTGAVFLTALIVAAVFIFVGLFGGLTAI